MNNKPLFSVMIACYEVEQYLDALFRSFEWQDIDASKIEYIFVDDASTDGTAAKIQAWARKKKNAIFIQQSKNQGPGAARNAALDVARGEWVTSVDPDDILDRSYFSAVERMLDDGKEFGVSLVATKVLILNDETGKFTNNHPLGYRFAAGDRFVELKRDPFAIQMGATGFLRREIIENNALRFNSNIRPSFEDGNLICRYLMAIDDPIIGLCESSIYYYRKRADQSSLVQSGWSDPEKYSNQPKFGYLPLLREAAAKGDVPAWLQNVVLYDMFWYFMEDLNMRSKTAWVAEEPGLRDEFISVVTEIFSYIEYERLLAFGIQNIRWVVREAIAAYFYPNELPRLHRWGTEKGERKYTLVVRDFDPSEYEFYAFGRPVKPHFEIVRRRFYGTNFCHEVSFNLPDSDSTIWYRGKLLKPVKNLVKKPALPKSPKLQTLHAPYLSELRQKPVMRKIVRNEVYRLTTGASVKKNAVEILQRKISGNAQTGTDDEAKAKLQSKVMQFVTDPSFENKYKGCWILSDRTDRAGDNGEHICRYLLNNCPEITPVFLLAKDSVDWKRLEDEGFPLLEYGSSEAMAAFLLCEVNLSSDAVESSMYPAPRAVFGDQGKPFIFLQHGISDKDISRWINDKKISGFVCGAQKEYEAFAGDESPYVLKTSQLLNTGFPRFDRLKELRTQAVDLAESGKRTLLVMPTWRGYLSDLLARPKDEQVAEFKQSEFYVGWNNLLNSKDFVDLLEEAKLDLRLILHPNLTPYVDCFDLPSGVNAEAISDVDFQKELANSSLFITDYSSTAFDAGVIGVPVIYYQFDEGAIFKGVHNYRRGWYDPKKFSIGHVATDVSELLNSLDFYIKSSFERNDAENEELLEFYGHLDTSNCERVVKAVKELLL